jgi:hypothetical protein
MEINIITLNRTLFIYLFLIYKKFSRPFLSTSTTKGKKGREEKQLTLIYIFRFIEILLEGISSTRLRHIADTLLLDVITVVIGCCQLSSVALEWEQLGATFFSQPPLLSSKILLPRYSP